MSEKSILVTGFDPFGGQEINPAWEAARRLPPLIGPCRLHTLQVPTVYGRAGKMVLACAQTLAPAAIVCLGQAAGRAALTPEMVGINLRYATAADNAGNCPQDVPVVPGAPAAYFATLPVRAMAQAIREAGYPGEVSYSAGTFVCNDLLYTLLHHYAGSGVQVGFVHLPLMEGQQADKPFLPLVDTVDALQASLTVVAQRL